jgi:hypothetical protein
VGDNSDAVAQAFYTWVIDGGLEDQIIDELDRLTDGKTSVEGIMDFGFVAQIVTGIHCMNPA